MIVPTGPVASGLGMINFNPEVTKPMIELGKKDAADALKLTEGRGFELLEKYMEMDHEFKETVAFHEYYVLNSNL